MTREIKEDDVLTDKSAISARRISVGGNSKNLKLSLESTHMYIKENSRFLKPTACFYRLTSTNFGMGLLRLFSAGVRTVRLP